LASARSRNSPTIIMVPTNIADTSSTPQTVSHSTGPRTVAPRRAPAAAARDASFKL